MEHPLYQASGNLQVGLHPRSQVLQEPIAHEAIVILEEAVVVEMRAGQLRLLN